nr:hypothetical protein [Actinomycetota bacterium]
MLLRSAKSATAARQAVLERLAHGQVGRQRERPGTVGRHPWVSGRRAGPSRRPPLTRLADALDRFLLPLVVLAAAVGIAWPAPGRHLDAGNAILITLAILVFCTGASMTFGDIGALKTASGRLVLVLAGSTVALPAFAWLASHLVSGAALR